MNTRLSELVQISQFYGSNPEYVIAGGGNTSFKDDHHLWIKASGTSLATITEEGFAKMNRDCLNKISEKKYSDDPLKREAEIKDELYNCIAGDKSKRPSVETSLHNLLDYSFVVHTHPTLINALMCSKNARQETQEIFGSNALFVEYTDPGYVLFKLVEKRINEYKAINKKEPEIIFLENHGVFVSSNSTQEITDIYDYIREQIGAKVKHTLPSSELKSTKLEELVNILKDKTKLVGQAFSSDIIEAFVKDDSAFEKVNTAFTPDNIVYCKAHYLFSDADPKSIYQDYLDFQQKYGYPPRVIGVKNKGIICLEENEKSVLTVYEVFLDMLKISFLAENFGGPKFMTDKQIEFIDNWEVENYRRKIAKQG